MANEIDITELPFRRFRGELQVYTHQNIVSQQINASAVQDNSAAFADTTQMISVLNTHTAACRIRVWDSAGTVDATNSMLLNPNERVDIMVAKGQGQIISSKIV